MGIWGVITCNDRLVQGLGFQQHCVPLAWADEPTPRILIACSFLMDVRSTPIDLAETYMIFLAIVLKYAPIQNK